MGVGNSYGETQGPMESSANCIWDSIESYKIAQCSLIFKTVISDLLIDARRYKQTKLL